MPSLINLCSNGLNGILAGLFLFTIALHVIAVSSRNLGIFLPLVCFPTKSHCVKKPTTYHYQTACVSYAHHKLGYSYHMAACILAEMRWSSNINKMRISAGYNTQCRFVETSIFLGLSGRERPKKTVSLAITPRAHRYISKESCQLLYTDDMSCVWDWEARTTYL